MSRLTLRVLSGGHCVHPEHVVLQNGSLRPLRFPSLYAVLEHPTEGLSLFDTGYCSHFVEATRPFPERLYAWVTPVTVRPEDTAVYQLGRLGYAPTDVRQVFVSHFHADHISALRDFPRARFRFWPEAFAAVKRMGRVKALSKGVLPALLPVDFEGRSEPLTDGLATLPALFAPFRHGLDVFGDGSCWAVRLPGHASGQLGLFVTHTDGRRVLLAADACWTRHGFEVQARPHPVTHLLFDAPDDYYATLARLADLHAAQPELLIVPSHCEHTFAQLDLQGSAAAG